MWQFHIICFEEWFSVIDHVIHLATSTFPHQPFRLSGECLLFFLRNLLLSSYAAKLITLPLQLFSRVDSTTHFVVYSSLSSTTGISWISQLPDMGLHLQQLLQWFSMCMPHIFPNGLSSILPRCVIQSTYDPQLVWNMRGKTPILVTSILWNPFQICGVCGYSYCCAIFSVLNSFCINLQDLVFI